MNFQKLFSGKTIVVTGGCGFIGSHLVRQLAALGASQIRIIDSLKFGKAPDLETKDAQVTLHKLELGASPSADIRAACRDADYLFHLAAEKHNSCLDDPARVYRANVIGTHELIASAVAEGIKRVVFSSSLYTYGRMKGEPMSEDEIPIPRTAYGISKLAGEQIVRMFHVDLGLPAVVLRYFFVYGPKQFVGMGYKSVIIKNFERLLHDEPPIIRGDGLQTLDYIYVDDVVRSTLAAMASDISFDILNIGSGTGTPIRDLVELMIAVHGNRVKPIAEPPDFTAGSSRVSKIDKAARVLGHTCCVDLIEGLRRTLNWMQTQREWAVRE